MIRKNDLFNNEKIFYFDDPFKIAEYAKKHFPADCATLIKNADDIAAQKILFNQRWDMERSFVPVHFPDEIDWLHMPSNDPEWIFALNRMRFWISLGQAYALTGDEKYTLAFVKQLNSWITNVPKEKTNAWRSIEVGLRLGYWFRAIYYFKSSPNLDDETVNLFCESVKEQAEFIMDTWNNFNLISNWGVLANQGLFTAGLLLPHTDRTKEYVNTALMRLEREINIQVYRDGSHWEQSPMYHNEVLCLFLDVITLARRNGVLLPEVIEEKARLMCYVDLYSARPDHMELPMGDSDVIDQRDLLCRGAYLFSDGVLKNRGGSLPDFDCIWDLGEAGIHDYLLLDVESMPKTDKAFEDAGNFYFRSSWEDDATFIHFHCGPLGAGHGHADQLHFDVFSRDEDILVDAGRFTYVFGSGREEHKASSSHNVAHVDGKEFYPQKDCWECFELSRGINRSYYSNENYGYAEGAHLFYMFNGCNVLHNRRLIYIKPDILVIADEFYASGQHSYQRFFHWNNKGVVTLNDNTCVYRSDNVCGQLILPDAGLANKLVGSKLSRTYNSTEDNIALVSESTGIGFHSTIAVLGISEDLENKSFSVKELDVFSNHKKCVFSKEEIQGYNISFGDEKYTLVIAHKEYNTPSDVFIADGCVGFGSVVVFNRSKNETETGTVLTW